MLSPFLLPAQILRTAWDRDYGGNIWEDCNSAVETSDGGYLLGGYTSSTVTPMGDVSEPSLDGFFPPPDVGDFWIVKTDDQGILLWDRRYGGNKQDRLWSAQETPDGGYILGGASNSDVGPQKTGANRGDEDYWLIKTDALGVIQWDQTYGSDSIDYFYSLLQTSDGGYLLGGISRSDIGFEKTETHRGDYDLWLIKTDPLGNVIWDKTIGGAAEERLNEMQETPDGHYVIAGSTASDRDNVDVLTDGFGGKDYWLIKVDSANGGKIWEYRYGGIEEDEIQSFTQTQDGGFLLGGGSRSPVSAMKQKASQWVDFWIVKIDDLGTIEWEQTFGGPELENCYSVKQNSIGNYLVAGYSASDIGPDKTEANRGPVGTEDFWLLYLAPDGTKLWDKTLGGNSRDVLENIFQTTDGGYLLAGHSSSPPSGDKQTANQGLNDFWIIKTLCNVEVEFKDTIVCPNTDVLLNASDTSCIQCSWRWENGTTDSIRIINTSQAGSYAVTLVDGVGCSWSDDIQIDMYTPPVLDLGPDLTICSGDSVLIGTSLTGLDYAWSTGESSNAITIDTAGNYRLVVTDGNTCTARDSINLSLHDLPQVNLGNDTSICAGEYLLLNAGNPGAQFNWWPIGDQQILNPYPIGPFTYSVTVTDANNCQGIDSLTVLNVHSQPTFNDLSVECNELNTHYTVSFSITDGDPTTYAVTGGQGNLNSGNFISDSISRNLSYTFYLDDANECGPVEISGNFDCACETDAGVLEDSPWVICGNQSFSVPHSNSNLDHNDVIRFILHDGTSGTVGNILFSQTTPDFQFQAPLVYGQTYYVVALAGNNENGSVNLQDGCLSYSNAVSVVFYENPTARIVTDLGTRITCGNPSVPLSGTSSEPLGNLDFFWQVVGMGNITSPPTAAVIEVDQAGTYQLIVTDKTSGCTASEIIMIEEDAGVPDIVIAAPNSFTCKDSLISLDASGSSFGAPYEVAWIGGNIDGYSGLDPVVNAPGIFTLEILNTDNDCTVSQTVVVPADTLRPMVDAGGEAILDCINETVILNGNIDVDCSGCSFVWNTRDGHFSSGTNTLNPVADLAGVYELYVFNPENGCSNKDSVMVIEDPDVPADPLLEINHPSCHGDDNGYIGVATVTGGRSPYLFALNGSSFGSGNEFADLAPGDYQLSIQDAKGCEWDTLINLPEASSIFVDLGADQIIDLGEDLFLQAIVIRPVDSVAWLNADVECPDCLEQWVRPVEETRYQVQVFDAAGCVGTDFMVVKVRKNRDVFIPTAFSSDFNGINDYFTVYAGKSVQKIKSLRVFSRWGELVFERENFQPNIETLGWDGTMRGKDMDPGIYVYSAVIEFIDGEEEVFGGDVLLTK